MMMASPTPVRRKQRSLTISLMRIGSKPRLASWVRRLPTTLIKEDGYGRRKEIIAIGIVMHMYLNIHRTVLAWLDSSKH
jgi:hypothetical protein